MPQGSERSFFSSQDSPLEKRILAVLRGFMYAGFGIACAMMLMTVVHGLGRYFFNAPILGMVEISCFLLVTLVFLMVAYTMVEKRFICITFVVDRFSPRAQAIADIISYTICLLLEMVCLWQAILHGNVLLTATQVSPILKIPPFPFLFVVAFGWALLAVPTVLHLIHSVRRAVKR